MRCTTRNILMVAAIVGLVAAAGQAANILYVGRHTVDPGNEPAYFGEAQALLSTHSLTYMGAGGLTAAAVADLPLSYDMVVIASDNTSSSVPAEAEDAFGSLALPMLCEAVFQVDDLGWTTAGDERPGEFVTVDVENATHPIWDGVTPTGGQVDFYTSGGDPRPLNAAEILADGGDPTVLASRPSTGNVVLIAWDTGAKMVEGGDTTTSADDFFALDRRVFMTPQGFGAGVDSLTADGQIAYKNAVEWALVPEPATMSLLGLGGLVALRRRRRA